MNSFVTSVVLKQKLRPNGHKNNMKKNLFYLTMQSLPNSFSTQTNNDSLLICNHRN